MNCSWVIVEIFISAGTLDRRIFRVFIFQHISSTGRPTTIDQFVASLDILVNYGILVSLVVAFRRAHYFLLIFFPSGGIALASTQILKKNK